LNDTALTKILLSLLLFQIFYKFYLNLKYLCNAYNITSILIAYLEKSFFFYIENYIYLLIIFLNKTYILQNKL